MDETGPCAISHYRLSATSFLENLGPGLATLNPTHSSRRCTVSCVSSLNWIIDVASNTNSHCDGIIMAGLIEQVDYPIMSSL
jgi:hypothetical protein